MRQTMRLLCRLRQLKIKIFNYPFIMRPNNAFTLQNMPCKKQDVDATFRYETNTIFTLQIMLPENQELYLPFCEETGQGIYFAEYAL